MLTFDGVGEWASTAWGVASGDELQLRQEIHFPHSLGLLIGGIGGMIAGAQTELWLGRRRT